jgi:thiamine-phosphate pyrophosphorylase
MAEARAPEAGLRGLYAITSDAICADPGRLLAAAAAAMRGGAVLVQYRDKRSDAAARAANAQALAALAHRHGVGLIINDDAALAAKVNAAGVHLGAADGPLAEARARLGAGALIGASCGPYLERARTALAAGASYLAFGRFFDSRTKPDAPPASIERLRAARAEFRVPICAIGGITPDNGAALIAAGADLLAAVEGVFGDPDPAAVEAAARAYSRLFA